MTTFKHIGSVSHATMRPEDLIPRFVDLLTELNEARSMEWKAQFGDELHAVQAFSRIDNRLREIEQSQSIGDYFDTENADYDLEWLFDALYEFAPSGFYFGAHPGDGSDYGFWLSEDFIDEFDGLRVEDTSEVPDDYHGEVLHVNDHGNCTLYVAEAGKLTEVWGIV